MIVSLIVIIVGVIVIIVSVMIVSSRMRGTL